MNTTTTASKRIALACFVKTPGLSPVKTRLACGIGKTGAESIYRACVEFMRESMVVASSNFPSGNSDKVELHPHWAVAEKEAVSMDVWSDLPVIFQGDGGLGSRLKLVFERLAEEFDGVILLGADCPWLAPDVLQSAARLVANSERHVLGPTDDGGYYIFGSRFQVDLKSSDTSKSIWLNVPYSAPNTAETFVAMLSIHRPVANLDKLFDIDTKEDLERLVKADQTSDTIWNRQVIETLRTIAGAPTATSPATKS